MTGKVIDNSANGILILLLPIAFSAIVLFKAWPYLLALLIVTIAFKVWQQYQWQQWSREVNPFFNQLIKENQGCLTPLDLAIKANISGAAAQRFLDRKAAEFGAKSQEYEDKGIVYYFITASALGSLFESSEPPLQLEYEALISQAPKLIKLLSDGDESTYVGIPEIDLVETEDEGILPVETEDEGILPVETEDQFVSSKQTKGDFISQVKKHLFDDDDELPTIAPETTKKIPKALIQSELAKRLDVHPSTIGKRKSDRDFPQWSKSKDPDGIAWEYSSRLRAFVALKRNRE